MQFTIVNLNGTTTSYKLTSFFQFANTYDRIASQSVFATSFYSAVMNSKAVNKLHYCVCEMTQYVNQTRPVAGDEMFLFIYGADAVKDEFFDCLIGKLNERTFTEIQFFQIVDQFASEYAVFFNPARTIQYARTKVTL